MKTVIFCAAVLLVGLQMASAQPKYVPANIVESLADCPVKSVAFAPEVFDVGAIFEMADVLQAQGVSQKCQDAAMDLGTCAGDGVVDKDDPSKMSSLAINTGCCSKACAEAIKGAVESGCQAQYIKAVCAKQATVDKFGAGLLSLGTRCSNFAGSCPGMKLPTAAPAKTNATTASPAATTATPAAPTETPASPAASTPSPSPKPPGSGAAASSVSLAAVLLVAAAAGAAAVAL